MNLPELAGRDNLVLRDHEVWRPPAFQPETTLYAAWLARLRRFLDLQAASIWRDLRLLLAHCQGTVLDVGCGAQPYRNLLPNGVKYTGIDTADAAARFGYKLPDVIYFEGDVWPIPSSTIDTVIATETLEHVAQPRQFLLEARRVLKPDGWLLLTVPFAARWHYLPHDYWRFTPSGLATVLTDAGFRVPTVYARGNAGTVACYKVMTLIVMLLGGEFRQISVRIAARILGCLLFPIFVFLAAVGQLSLNSRGGNDCLGYTVITGPQKLTRETAD
jgi:SAM-dependent methyltransferase